jgi:hypothetical protein
MVNEKSIDNRNAKQLINNYKTIDGKLQELKSFLQELDRLLEKVLRNIAVPRDVSLGLTGLDDMLLRIHTLLTNVMIVPPITQAVDKFRSEVAQKRGKVHPLREKVNEIENGIAPYRKYIADTRVFFREMVPLIQNLDEFIQREHTYVTKTDSSNTALEDGRYKRTQQQELENFSAGINKDLVEPMKTIDKMLKAGQDVANDLENISGACGILSELLKPVLSLLDHLTILEKSLAELDKALDQKVSLVYYIISIRELFSTGDTIPFRDKLTENALKMLAPLLDKLDLQVSLSTPGIDKSESEMRRVLDNCKSIEGTMKVMQPQMTDMFRRKSLESTINSHDA